jgi:hypothetical protein
MGCRLSPVSVRFAAAAVPLAFFAHGSTLNDLLRNGDDEAWEGFARSIPKPRATLASTMARLIGRENETSR